jgi:hypothetical protein
MAATRPACVKKIVDAALSAVLFSNDGFVSPQNSAALEEAHAAIKEAERTLNAQMVRDAPYPLEHDRLRRAQ